MEAKDLITKILERDPNMRISIQDIYNHPWMKVQDEKVNLFDEQELEYIRNNFTYGNKSRLNRNEKRDLLD